MVTLITLLALAVVVVFSAGFVCGSLWHSSCLKRSELDLDGALVENALLRRQMTELEAQVANRPVARVFSIVQPEARA